MIGRGTTHSHLNRNQNPNRKSVCEYVLGLISISISITISVCLGGDRGDGDKKIWDSERETVCMCILGFDLGSQVVEVFGLLESVHL